jgi:hypothetical protein
VGDEEIRRGGLVAGTGIRDAGAMAQDVSGTRVLLVTEAVVADVSEVPLLARGLMESACDVLVVTPILPTRLQWLASDIDRATHEADERLQAVMGQVGETTSAVRVQGMIGDESPITALNDAVARFQPDHILIGLRAENHDDWQERHLIERIRERFHIPLTVFEIDRRGHVAGVS